MTRADRRRKNTDMIKSYAETFRKEFKRDIGFDLRSRIDREKRAEIRGAMLAAEREVYKELRVALGDAPGGPLDRDGVEVEEAGKGTRI